MDHHEERTVMEKVNLGEKLAQFSEQWKPKIVGELNGQQVKLVKFQGPFVWHHHDHEDELFFVVKGRFRAAIQNAQMFLAVQTTLGSSISFAPPMAPSTPSSPTTSIPPPTTPPNPTPLH